jgi:two-component system, NarL family, response regulator LiaR
MKIKVAIIEDQREIRESFCILINESQDIECVHAFSNSEDAIKYLPEINPDVALVDIHLPGMSGIECISKLKESCPKTQYLICTVFEDNDNIFNALKAGANGYILKNTPPSKLLDSIREVYGGGSPITSHIARKVIGIFQNPMQINNEAASILTTREKEMLTYLSKGFRYKEIADKMFISHETVKTHIRNIYEKLHVQSRLEALNKVGIF